MRQFNLRTPISYYGGKQKFVRTIVGFMPEHKMYVEPFLGGAAVYFGKQASEIEVINDTNKEVINFYRVLNNRYHELSALVRVTLHSRDDHDNAWIIYNKPQLFDEVRRAWAIWVLSTQSFSADLGGSWGYDKSENTTTKKITNKREQFVEDLAFRLQSTQIGCSDVLYIIGSRDTLDSFFYCDPPYYNSDCGHYNGYKESDFEELLTNLSSIKGKFLLSSYPSDVLSKYVKAHGWHQWSIESNVSVNAKGRSGYQKRKTEMLTANYELK
jgi:DNA adenine methylase